MAAPYRFCVLAPTTELSSARHIGGKSAFLAHPQHCGGYAKLLSSMQRLRGQLYLADGAIPEAALDDRGRFCMDDDELCWHLLLLEGEEVVGCVRYRRHTGPVSYDDLRLQHSAVAQHPALGAKVRRAVEQELASARLQGLSFVEIGGWALANRWRHTQAALQLLAGSYALGALWGGCLGVATATLRHRSAAMLRRIGGRSLQVDGEELPPYKDPAYGCHMEILRFDRHPNARFAPLVDEVIHEICASAVFIPQPATLPAVACYTTRAGMRDKIAVCVSLKTAFIMLWAS